MKGAPKRILPGILFLLCSFFSAAGTLQDIDSLKKALSGAQHDTTRVQVMNKLSRQYLLRGKQDTALLYANESISLCKKSHYDRGMGGALNSLANIYVAQGKRDEALRLFEEAVKIQKSLHPSDPVKRALAGTYSNIGSVYLAQGKIKDALDIFTLSLQMRKGINDSEGMAAALTNIAICHYYDGNYPLSIKNNLEAIKIEKLMGDKMAEARSYNNTGNIYLHQANYEEALKYFKHALDVQTEINDRPGMGRSYNNVGAIYVYQKKLDEALKYFYYALPLNKEVNDKSAEGRTYLNLGSICLLKVQGMGTKDPSRTGLLVKAREFLDTGLTILRDFGDKQGQAMAHNNLGAAFTLLGDPHKSREHLNKGLAFASEIGSLDDLKTSYQGLAGVDSMEGKWKDAFEHHKLYVLYRDSINNAENTKKIVQAEMNFEFEQKELKEKIEQEKTEALYQEKIERQRILGWSIAGIAVLALLSTVLFFNRAKLKQKNLYQQQLHEQQQKQAAAVIEVQEQERKRIAEDLHDSLGHLLSTAKLNLQSVPEEQKKHYTNTLHLLDQASQEIRNISFNLMPQTLEEQGLIPALYELADKVRKSRLYDILIRVHNMDNLEFDQQTKFNIYRIVQEAVNNILKHADAKEISIQLVKQEESLSIMIEDDGKGFNMAEVKKFGRGLKNITARSEWLHGTITIDSTPGRGTTISIEIPLKKK
jgi:two-component system, NarL family, sensor kinase